LIKALKSVIKIGRLLRSTCASPHFLNRIYEGVGRLRIKDATPSNDKMGGRGAS